MLLDCLVNLLGIGLDKGCMLLAVADPTPTLGRWHVLSLYHGMLVLIVVHLRHCYCTSRNSMISMMRLFDMGSVRVTDLFTLLKLWYVIGDCCLASRSAI